MPTAENNAAHIAANRKAIFDIESEVAANRAAAYETRSLIADNAALLRKNYEAAFSGNRQLANYNTDAAFRNRYAVARNLPATTPAQVNFRESLTNEGRLEFLDHRSKLNARVLAVSQKLADINAKTIEAINDIMKGNEEIVAFNRGVIARNADLIEHGAKQAKDATPASNAAVIAGNRQLIDTIRARVAENRKHTEEVRAAAQANHTAILKASRAIYERRDEIKTNARRIRHNHSHIAEFIVSHL